MSHSTEKFRRGTLRCFRKFLVSKNFMHKKGVSLFSVEIFCLIVLKNFVAEHFSVSENFGFQKTLSIKEGGITFPRGTFFHLTVPIKIVGEHICVSEEFWYRKFSRTGEGKLQGFSSKIFFSHRTEKASPGNHSVF